MARVPSIVSIDCTQTCVLQDATSALERWSLQFNVRRDGEILRRAAAIVATSRWTEREVRAALSGLPGADPRAAQPGVRSTCSTLPGRTSAGPGRRHGRSACSWAATFRVRVATICSPRGRPAASPRRADLTLVTDWPLRPPSAGVRQQAGVRGADTGVDRRLARRRPVRDADAQRSLRPRLPGSRRRRAAGHRLPPQRGSRDHRRRGHGPAGDAG